MSTILSGIQTAFAPKKANGKQHDTSESARLVSRLGDVKAETKTTGGPTVIDNFMPLDRFNG